MLYKKYKKIIQVLLISNTFLLFSYGISVSMITAAIAGEAGQRTKKTDSRLNDLYSKEGKMADEDKLTDQEGEYLLTLARRTIEKRLFGEEDDQEKEEKPSDKYLEKRGTFVTLNINNNLRGCIGHIIPQESLIDGIRINAINSAFRDPRFRPMTKEEWKNVKIEISILTEPELLSYSDAKDLLNKLRPGIDGVILKKGHYQATFLPQVWEQLPDKRMFLNHLCLKAGMNENEWLKGDLQVYIYQVQAFEEH
jgi:AmmeMemoRadiSam system protein A